MKKTFIAAAICIAFSVPAFAGGNSNNSDTINNYGGNTTNQGGSGGTGIGVGVGVGIGQGGNASATGGKASATGGSVLGSGNSANSNKNDNRNTNSNLNAQGQQQGQQQGQGQSQSSKSNAQQGQAQSTSNANNSSLSVGGDTISFEAQKRDPVSSAVSFIAAPSAPCMGSSSIGAQTVAVGFSMGTTWTSEECNKRENIRIAYTYGDKDVAEEMMQTDIAGYAAAKQRIADRKAGKAPEASTKPAAFTAPTVSAAYTGNDPIVMARLGMLPAKK